MKDIKLHNLPAYYFPTQVVLVDDNQHFLDSVNLHLDPDEAIYQFYNNPLKALNFLNSFKGNSFIFRCISQDEDHDLIIVLLI